LFLFSVGIFFLFIELLTKIDKSLIFYGILDILLCTFCALDIYVSPQGWDANRVILQHVIAPFLLPFLLLHIYALLKEKLDNLLVFLLISACLFSLGFLGELFVRKNVTGMSLTWGYYYLFIPYVVGSILVAMVRIGSFITSKQNEEKFVLKLHLIGFTFLASCALLDMYLMVTKNSVLSIDSFMVFGVLLYGFVLFAAFSRRLKLLMKEKETAYANLRLAYKELENTKQLLEIGKSSLFVSHEIKNYAFAIGGLTKVLLAKQVRPDLMLKVTGQIQATAKKLMDFSCDIAAYSNAKILNKERLDFKLLISSCVETILLQKKIKVTVKQYGPTMTVLGDKEKIKQVFINLFKNSFEANATEIYIELLYGPNHVVVSVEDNGKGCLEVPVDKYLDAFFTTKKSSFGNGLGMAIVKSIVEGHGGVVQLYSKNQLINGETGFIVELSFPMVSKKLKNTTHTCVFIKTGETNFDKKIMLILSLSGQNILFLSEKEYEDVIKSSSEKCMLFAASSFYKKNVISKPNVTLFIVCDTKTKTPVVSSFSTPNKKEIFSSRWLYQVEVPIKTHFFNG